MMSCILLAFEGKLKRCKKQWQDLCVRLYLCHLFETSFFSFACLLAPWNCCLQVSSSWMCLYRLEIKAKCDWEESVARALFCKPSMQSSMRRTPFWVWCVQIMLLLCTSSVRSDVKLFYASGWMFLVDGTTEDGTVSSLCMMKMMAVMMMTHMMWKNGKRALL